MKAATAEELAADPLNPSASSVTIIETPHGESVTKEQIETALKQHKPKWAFMAHWETGSGRINDIKGFSEACTAHNVMGLVDAVSSLGVEDFSIDDYPGVAAWASCPQKGICCLPLTYAPVSFTDRYISHLQATGARTFVHHPLLEARHWGIIDGADVEQGTYHRTHSPYAIAAFHEALRLTVAEGVSVRAKRYSFHEGAMRSALTALGCNVTSNMTSLLVLNLPESMAGKEAELVKSCREAGFGIWPTLSQPIQIRIGILNQLERNAVSDIIMRFAKAMALMNRNIDSSLALAALDNYYESHTESAVTAA